MGTNNYDIGRGISILYRHAQSYISSQLKDLHIGSGQYIYLLVLYKHDGINQEALSDYLKIDKGTTARAIRKLEQEGYIHRVVDPEDRRANHVFITDKAREIQPIIYGVLGEWNDIMVKNLTDEEQNIAKRVLMKMVDNTISFVKQEDCEQHMIQGKQEGVQYEREKL